MQIAVLKGLKFPKLQIKTYQELSKSGITTLVIISVLGGYLIGHPFDLPMDWSRMILTLLGVYLLASGSSAFNQIQEIKIDARMPRTANRPLPSGKVSISEARTFVFFTVASGLFLLLQVGIDLFFLGLIALLSYNVLYTLWWKPHWHFGAVPGAIPGALPILIGFAAASGHTFSPGGVYLFWILFFWQLPHFWVLAIRYQDDYQKGGIPTLSVSKGMEVTLFQIKLWCMAYIGLTLIAPLFFPVGMIYFITTLLISTKLVFELRSFLKQPESKSWLKFFLWVNFSLITFLGSLAADLWSIYLIVPLTR